MSVTSDTLPSIGLAIFNNVIEWLARLDPQVLLLGCGGSHCARAAARGRRARPPARLRLAGGAFYLLLGAFLALLGSRRADGRRPCARISAWTHEQLAARVSIRQLGERHFALTLQPPAETPRQFEVRGDEGRSTRACSMAGLATLAGFDTSIG